MLFADARKRMYSLSVLIVLLFLTCFVAQVIVVEPPMIQPTISWVVADKTIVIDPGHGGMFPGKVSNSGVLEKDINLAISQKLNQILVESGSMVVMTRQEDVDLVDPNVTGKKILKLRSDLTKRVAITNENNGELFISIHCNSAPSSKWTGSQVFYTPGSQSSEELAKAIQASLNELPTGNTRQALARKDTFLFEHISVPAVIVECGFLSNEQETILLQNEDYQEQIAYCIYRGLANYLSADLVQVQTP